MYSELPCLDEAACSGCRLCVDVCPVNCLEMDERLPWLPRPDDCVSCSLCVFVCPDSAIAMKLPSSAA